MIVNFDGLKPWHYKDIKGILAPETGQKSFRAFEKPASGKER